MPRIKTFYDELGLPRDATAAAIKHAFKEVAKVYHPDKNPPEKQAWAHEQMSRYNFIMETLLNPTTRREYDDLVHKYETAPLVTRPRLRPREQNALEREYAQVSVELMNLVGRYSNWRLKLTIGAFVGGFASLMHLAAYFGPLVEISREFPITFAFSYFFTLIGGVMTIMGISDYLGRAQYRRRIRELEKRRSQLRARMYEAFVPD